MSRRWGFAAAAMAATALSLLLIHDHTREDSFSADEPVHILAGYFEVFARTALVNIEHPPLMKILAGVALKTLPLPDPPARVPLGNRFTDFGHAFLFAGPVPPDAIAAAARFPFLLLFGLLLLLVFFWGRSRYGDAAALLAVGLLAFDPNLAAHAGVVHTDLGATLAFLAAVLAWDAARLHPTAPRLLLAALALGLALATKFSAVYLLPILLVQGLLGARDAASPGRETLRMLGRLFSVAAGALVVLLAVYALVTARMDREDQRRVIHEMVAERGAPRLSQAIENVARACPPLGHYLGGVASVARQNAEGGGVNYLLGRVRVHGFPLYFFVAFLAKSTLAFLLVTALALGAAARDRAARRDAALLLLPVLVLFLASLGSSYNIGIRHMLPVYPFLALAAAGVFSRMWESRLRHGAALLAVALPLLSAVELARVHPHELSYFNPLVGGPVGGRRILSDSNVDWGLDLKRLARELARRRVADPTVVYFGGDDVLVRTGVQDFSSEPVVRGRLVAISAFHAAVGPEFYAYHGAPLVAGALERLRRDLAARGRLVGRVGFSIDLYELAPKGTTAR